MKINRTLSHNTPKHIQKWSIVQILKILSLLCVLLLSVLNQTTASAADQALELTPKEITWLNENKDNIRYGPNPYWPPGDYMENGEHKGIVSDYIRIFEKKLGITFKRVYYDDWDNFYKAMMTGELDLIGAAQETEARKKVLLFTKPFLRTRLAVLTRANRPALNALDDLNTMTLAGIKGYSSVDYVKTKYPGAKIIECDDDLTVLLKVSAGAADGAIVDYMIASYLIDKYSLTNIKYAKELDFHWDLRFAINKKMPQLRSILDKVLGTISEDQRQKIYHKWVSIKLERKPGFMERHLRIIIGIFSLILFLLLVAIFFNRSLKQQVFAHTRDLKENSLKLQESRESLQAILDSAGDAIIVNNADTGQIIAVNRRMTEMYGYSHEDVLKIDLKDLSLGEPPFSLVEALEWLRKAREMGPQTFEWLSRNKYGDTFWVEVKVNFAVIGGANRFVIVVRDITERKQAFEAIRKANEKMRLAADAAHVGIWNFNIREKRLEWDNWMFRLYGIRREKFSGAYEAWQSGIHPDDLERSNNEVKLALRGEKEFDTMFRIVHPDGHVRHIKAYATVSRDSQGHPIYMTGVNYDITEQVKTNAALKESEERFRALHNASFGGIVIHDKGIILECNKGLSEITGYAYDELIGMNGLSLISDDTRDRVVEKIEAGYEKPYEATGIRKNGELYPLRIEARNIPFKGKPVRVVEFRDISENKQAEKEREELEVRLRQAQKMEAVGRLAGGVAHDFNNMLSVIIGNAEMALEQTDLPLPLHDGLVEIKKAGERSADLTRQLLAFARKQTVSPKVLDINATVAEVTKMLQRLIGEDIDLALVPGKNVWPVKVDPSQIDQILANLCVNARDAIADVGKITIETGTAEFDEIYCSDHPGFLPGGYVLLAVSDDGCGMDADTLDNIFEPFFTTKQSGQGTGLGLATVYGVVKQNNGFINVYSEPGLGTTFKIYLPRYREKADLSPEKVKGLPTVRGHETILLVEDEPAILKITTIMLERLGYRVVATSSPREAIRLAQEYAGDVHLLVSDVVMPEMNGRDLAKSILRIHPNLRRLFMSGYTANVIAHHGVLDEGVNFIQKPFSREQLGAKVREMLDGSGV